MISDFLILMKQEMVIVSIIFILIFLKLGKERSNENIMNMVNLLLLFNFIAGFFGIKEGSLFNEMFRTNHLIILVYIAQLNRMEFAI